MYSCGAFFRCQSVKSVLLSEAVGRRQYNAASCFQQRLIKHTLSIVEKKKRFWFFFDSWVLLTLKQLCMLPFFVKTSIFHYIVRIVFLSFAVFIVRDSLHKHHTTVFKKSDITIQQKIHKIGRKYHRFCDSADSNPYTIFIDNFSFIFRVSPELCL